MTFTSTLNINYFRIWLVTFIFCGLLVLFVVVQPTQIFGSGHYQLVALSPKNFLHTSPYLLDFYPNITSTALLARSPNLCACCTSKKVFFKPFPAKSINNSFVAFLGTKLGDTTKRSSSQRQYQQGWGVWIRRHCMGVIGSLSHYGLVQYPSKKHLSYRLGLLPLSLPKYLGS